MLVTFGQRCSFFFLKNFCKNGITFRRTFFCKCKMLCKKDSPKYQQLCFISTLCQRSEPEISEISNYALVRLCLSSASFREL